MPLEPAASVWHRSKQGCNVFVWCPASGGCDTGGGSKFPYQGCQLKSQPGLTAGSQPEAWGRGPGTTDFASGEFLPRTPLAGTAGVTPVVEYVKTASLDFTVTPAA